MHWKQKCHQPGETWIASPQSLPLHHTHPVHNLCALSRPMATVLNWTISRSTRRTERPNKQHAASRPEALLPPILETPLCQKVLHFRGVVMAKERSEYWCVDKQLCLH